MAYSRFATWLAVALILACQACLGNAGGPGSLYRINLDAAPEDRWRQVARDFPDAAAILQEMISQSVPKSIRPLAEAIALEIDKHIPAQYAAELRAMSTLTNASLADMLLLNVLYDATAFCTSIVAQDATGRIWHARNLDYHLTGTLRKLTILVEFTRANQVVYSGVTFVGMVGMLTGIRHGSGQHEGFSITLDERDKGAWWENALMAILYRPLQAHISTFLLRTMLDTNTGFEDALRVLTRADTIAPMYVIMGGSRPGQGAVVTKSHVGALDVWRLNPPSRWFLVETNYDHWTTPPPSDDRRTPAVAAMLRLGQSGVNATSLIDVLSIHPVLNNHTVYTAVMTAGARPVLKIW